MFFLPRQSLTYHGKTKFWLIFILFINQIPGSFAETSATHAQPLTFEVLQVAAHDSQSFTQGLVYEQGLLYESSGLYGKSFLQIYHAQSGELVKKQTIPGQLFAEGLSKVGNELYLLTWRSGILIRYDATSLKVKRTMRYRGEGWGLATMGSNLVMSNGSHVLSVRDVDNFQVLKDIQVKDLGEPVTRLNELEYDGLHLWANRWQSTWIYRIAPNSGQVTGKVDLSRLLPKAQTQPRPDVLNGIAFVAEKNAFWVSGKRWSKRYLIRIQEPKAVSTAETLQ